MASSSSTGSSKPVDKTSKAINEFIRKTSPKVEEAMESMQRKLRSTWSKIDNEFDVSSKAARLTTRGKETALDIDQQWGIRRKYKRYSEDFKRNLPRWSIQVRGRLAYNSEVLRRHLTAQHPIFHSLMNLPPRLLAR